jgi:hypothetical protein
MGGFGLVEHDEAWGSDDERPVGSVRLIGLSLA